LDLWEGTFNLLRTLPGLPDEAPVEGGDAYGAFEDLLGELPEEAGGPDPDDEGFLVGVGVPPDELDDPYGWRGWTAGLVRQGLAEIARHGEMPPEKVLAHALLAREEVQDKGKAEARLLEQRAKELRQRIRVQEDHLRQRRMLPAQGTLEAVA